MALKHHLVQKITKNRPEAGGFAPRPHSLQLLEDPPPGPVNTTFELQYTSLLNTSPNLDIFTF